MSRARRARLALALALPLVLALVLAPALAPAAPKLRGVNLSGLELNPGQLPGRLSFDYVAPTEAEFADAAAAGFSVIRLPIAWERLQPSLNGPLDPAMLGLMRALCAQAESRGLTIILDVHNYGAYRGQPIGSPAVPAPAYAALWAALAHAFAADPHVAFGLMNEPHDIDAVTWARTQQAAIDAIRAAGARNLILVSGIGWDGAHNFVSGDGSGPTNAQAFTILHDPAGAIAIELHQYLDHDFSGTHTDCTTPDGARRLLAPVTAWLHAQHRQGFLGEFAAAASPACLQTLSALLDAVNADPQAWLGWAYWAGGPWWSDDYPFSIKPQHDQPRPQMAVLRRAAAAP